MGRIIEVRIQSSKKSNSNSIDLIDVYIIIKKQINSILTYPVLYTIQPTGGQNFLTKSSSLSRRSSKKWEELLEVRIQSSKKSNSNSN